MDKLRMYQVVVKIDNGMVVTDKCVCVFAVSEAVAEKVVKDHYNSRPHTKVHYCKDVTEIPIKSGMIFNMSLVY
jgi:hypothetical protein